MCDSVWNNQLWYISRDTFVVILKFCFFTAALTPNIGHDVSLSVYFDVKLVESPVTCKETTEKLHGNIAVETYNQ
jgi:hypothetical protein